VTTAHIKYSHSSLDVAWERLPTAGFRTVPGLSYQLLTSHNSSSQLTQLSKSFYERRVGETISLLYINPARTAQETFLLLLHALSLPGIPSNGCRTVAFSYSCYLVTDLHVTIYMYTCVYCPQQFTKRRVWRESTNSFTNTQVREHYSGPG
jgi:hypothetical protein